MAVVGIPVNLTDIVITPTRTVLTVQARTMDVTVTFLSPIEVCNARVRKNTYSLYLHLQPDDLVLQSFPFTYMYIDVKSNDGQEHSVQLYCDLTGGKY